MKKVKLKGISQRGKNRIKEHGEIMFLKHQGEGFETRNAILCESRDREWMGWFEPHEVEILEVFN